MIPQPRSTRLAARFLQLQHLAPQLERILDDILVIFFQAKTWICWRILWWFIGKLTNSTNKDVDFVVVLLIWSYVIIKKNMRMMGNKWKCYNGNMFQLGWSMAIGKANVNVRTKWRFIAGQIIRSKWGMIQQNNVGWVISYHVMSCDIIYHTLYIILSYIIYYPISTHNPISYMEKSSYIKSSYTISLDTILLS